MWVQLNESLENGAEIGSFDIELWNESTNIPINCTWPFCLPLFICIFTKINVLNQINSMLYKYLAALLGWTGLGDVWWGFDDGQKMNSWAKSDVTPVVSDDAERSRPHAHSRNLVCQISVDQGRRFRLNHTEIRVNIRANGGFKLLQASVGRSRGPSCPFCVRAITSASC